MKIKAHLCISTITERKFREIPSPEGRGNQRIGGQEYKEGATSKGMLPPFGSNQIAVNFLTEKNQAFFRIGIPVRSVSTTL